MKIILFTLLRVKFEYRAVVARAPYLFLFNLPCIWWNQLKYLRRHWKRGAKARDCWVGRHTELVIDGFQGSGNSFATELFRSAQLKRVELAHHLHSPAQIIKACQLGLAIIVTVREPVGTITSLISRWPYVSTSQGLRSYIHFYEKLEPYAASFVVSPFEDTTTSLDRIVKQLNLRFGTDFSVPQYDDKDMQQKYDPVARIPIPKTDRNALKKRIAQELETPRYRSQLLKAHSIYARLTNHRS